MSAKIEPPKTTLNRWSLSNFFTIARFGPDTLFIFGILSVLIVALYVWGIWYLSMATAIGLGVILCVESVETISLSRAEYRLIVGAKCLVLRSASPESRGIVRLFNSDGNLDSELWSTEFSTSPVQEGFVATVTGIKSVILEIAKERDSLPMAFQEA